MLGVFVEYGAVEKFSGTSSVGYRYQIACPSSEDAANHDPAIYNKLQARLLKRTKIYADVGLPQVVQIINELDALLSVPPISFPGFADWSFREIFRLSNLVPTSNGSFFTAQFSDLLIRTHPFDTPYTTAPPTAMFSVRQLLTAFAN